MAGGATVGRTPDDERRRRAVFQAADDIRAEDVDGVNLRTVWARVKRDYGVAGNNQTIGRYFAEWTADRCYDPAIEQSGMPKSVSTRLAKAGVDLWEAAQAEAARIYQRDRQRIEAEVATERRLRDEALAMLDAREAVFKRINCVQNLRLERTKRPGWIFDFEPVKDAEIRTDRGAASPKQLPSSAGVLKSIRIPGWMRTSAPMQSEMP